MDPPDLNFLFAFRRPFPLRPLTERSFESIWPIRRKDIDRSLAIMADPVNRPIFVHCDGGYDRVGIVVACYRIEYESWTAAQAYEEMKQYGHNSYMLWWKWTLFKFAGEWSEAARKKNGLK